MRSISRNTSNWAGRATDSRVAPCGPDVAVSWRSLAPVLLVALLLGVAPPKAAAQDALVYRVKQGDTLYRIAVNHGMSVTQLRELNGIEGTVIKVGQVLKVANPMREPVPRDEDGDAGSAESVNPVGADPPGLVPAETVGGDSTETERRPATAGSAAQGEPAPPAAVSEGSVARAQPIIPAEPTAPAGARSPATSAAAARESSAAALTPAALGELQVPESQSLYDLAFRLGLPVDSLEALNPNHEAVLADGGTLRVPARYAGTTYTVKAGDTLYGIAADHGIRFRQLMASNPGIGETLRVGSVLKIPAVAGSVAPQLPLVVAEGPVSVYPAQFAGRLTASGVAYDPAAYHIAHPTLPFGTVVLIQNPATGRETFAEVVDRMPVSTDYVIEISEAVARALETSGGSIRMRIIHAEKQP